MFEITTYESKQRIKGAFVLAVLLAALTMLYVGLFPSIEQSGAELQAYMDNMPPAMQEVFGDASLTTIEGYLALELYQFIWLLFAGLYTAYTAGGLIAGDIDRDRMDLLLATPVSRAKVLVEKYLSLLTPILVLNLVVPVAVTLGLILIDESIAAGDLVMVHLLSLPYLLACGAIGLLLSVFFTNVDVAKRGGLGAIFGLFLVESVAMSADLEWLAAISPTHYYDPTAILVNAEYDWAGAVILIAVSVVLVVVSLARFKRMDLV